jgi:Rhs element Vgr protein
MAAQSPIDIADATIAYAITVNGNPIPDYCPILSIHVHHEVNRISFAEVVLVDGDIEQGTFPLSDSDDYAPGNPIEIKAGYGDSTVVSIFKGNIVRQGIRMNASSGYNLVLTCKHQAVGMTYTKQEAEFSNKSDSDIISSIIGTYGITKTVGTTSATAETTFQKLSTDWDFILSRAEFNGFIVTLDGDSITVDKPNISGSAVLRVASGESIINFSAELNAERQPPSLSANAWDIKNQALLTVAATEPTLNSQGNLTPKTLSGKLSQTAFSLSSCTPMLNDELQAWADGSLLKMRLSALKGEVSFQGSASVKPGVLIELAGVGARFDGSAFVSAVRHEIEQGMWVSNVKFGLDNVSVSDRPDFSYPAATGQLPAINGLQVATVKKISEDPASQYRIQVTLMSSADPQQGTWARMANFYASSGFGAGFTPEVGDEVVVGFLESDPRYPIILGSLYSDAHVTPCPATDENNYIKSLTTKSKLKISFDDDKKITKIETPGGNSFMLSDDAKSIEVVDQNGNSLKMTSSGIVLNSGKDITISATGNITLNATGKLNLTATQDVAVTGMNISNTANMGFTAKGNATAEVSAAGQTTVKGGIVMIN